MGTEKQACKVFCGGLSWETSSERLRAYFENFGVVREAFVSYNRNNGRPRGFGFVVFENSEVAEKVVSIKHTIDRREVECKKAVPKKEHENSVSLPSRTEESLVRTKKIFVGGLPTAVDDQTLLEHFQQYGPVEDAVVMYDHDNKRPRGFGFVTFASEECVEKVFSKGAMQTLLDKQVEIKPAIPRDQMPSNSSTANNALFDAAKGMAGIQRAGQSVLGAMPFAGLKDYGSRSGLNFKWPPGQVPDINPFLSAYEAAALSAQGLSLGLGSVPFLPDTMYGATGLTGDAKAANLYSSNAHALYNGASLKQPLNRAQRVGEDELVLLYFRNLQLKAQALASLGKPPQLPQHGLLGDSASAPPNMSQGETAASLQAAAVIANGIDVGGQDAHDFEVNPETRFSGTPGPGWSN